MRWLFVTDLLLSYLQVLSDAAKRRVYDKYGKTGLETKGQGQEKEEDPFDIFRKFYGFYGYEWMYGFEVKYKWNKERV